MFTYLDYARYGIEKLAGLSRLSRTVCEARDRFLRYPQEMIEYYNSVAKVIYGSSSVTDVTTVGDKNGFRAQSAARIGEIFKGLSSYEVPVYTRRTGYMSRPILTGLNIYLDGYIEDQKRMKVETCMVNCYSGKYLFTIGYIPSISYIVFVQALRVGADEGMYIDANLGSIHCRGIGKFSQGHIMVQVVTPEQIEVYITSFVDGKTRMSTNRNTEVGKFLQSPKFIIPAIQSGLLYFTTPLRDLDESTLPTEYVGVSFRTDSNIFDDAYSAYGRTKETFANGTFQPASPYAYNLWDQHVRISEAYEIAVNDATAIALMYVLSLDILAEIKQA